MVQNNSQSLLYGDMYETDKYVKLRFEIYKDLLALYLTENVEVLDIGCYTADLLKLFPHLKYFGIDSDEKALQIAKERGAIVMKLNLEDNQILLDQKFDVILATEVLEHLRDPEKLVQQIKCLLKENGVALLSLPNECTLYHRFKVLLGKGIDGTGFAPHYHLHFPTVKQNDEFIQKHFVIIEKRYWVHTGVGVKTKKILQKTPDKFWKVLANLWPALFARGVIYLCRVKK